MAARWSSEFIVTEHKDLQASAMAVDFSGSYALLAGRRCLAVVSLDDPTDTLRKLPRQSKYEVGAAEWNPTSANKELSAISSNQRVEIHSWHDGDLVLTHTLRSHTRVVSDVNWHRFDPNLLATCSIDTFIHVWDMRDTRRPASSLSAVAGATQVRWNRLSRHLLATAHDGDVKLWDQRKGTAPVQYISAHLAKIHGLDWSPMHENQLATSSQDCTVKFFDITNPRRAESIISIGSPVWRARYTPFGEGLVTVVVPQLRRGENSLLLWNISNQTSPVHTFVGHTDVVLEFEWRKHKEDTSDYQLITWSKDQSLRIWRIETFLQKLCGHEPDADQAIDVTEQDIGTTSLVVEPVVEAEEVVQQLEIVTLENGAPVIVGTENIEIISTPTTPAPAVSEKEVIPSPTQPKTLQQEFSLMNINIPNVQVDAMDAVRRTCTVTASVNGHVVVLLVNFPANYPFNSAPSFQFCKGTTVDSNVKTKLLKVLKQTAQQRVKKNRSCLEPCLRQLVSALQQTTLKDETDSIKKFRFQTQPTSFLESSNIYGSFQDAYIPFPRTSGAKFCGVGVLVCFCRPSVTRRVSMGPECSTPRSLSALGANLNTFAIGVPSGSSTTQYNLIYPNVAQSPTADGSVSISSFYFQDRKQKARSKLRGLNSTSRSNSKSTRAPVTLYDVSSLLLVHRELGEKYVFDCYDVPGMCHRNAAVAAAVGRRDLVQVWTLAAYAAMPANERKPEEEEDLPWPFHPFGRAMLESLISHYVKQTDVQTAAMLCCAFGTRTENYLPYKKKNSSKSVSVSPGGSPYHTIHPADTNLEGWNFPMLKQNRSNSWSDSLDEIKFIPSILEHHESMEPKAAEKPTKMLDDKSTHIYDVYKQTYSEILYRWQLLDARAQVLKYMSTVPERHRGVEFESECQNCTRTTHGAQCLRCKKLSLQCTICHVSVRGSSNFCLICGHGGHTHHMMAWFETESVCPSGCGCNCMVESSNVFAP